MFCKILPPFAKQRRSDARLRKTRPAQVDRPFPAWRECRRALEAGEVISARNEVSTAERFRALEFLQRHLSGRRVLRCPRTASQKPHSCATYEGTALLSHFPLEGLF